MFAVIIDIITIMGISRNSALKEGKEKEMGQYLQGGMGSRVFICLCVCVFLLCRIAGKIFYSMF